MVKVVHRIHHLPIHSYLLWSVFPSPVGNHHVLALFNPDLHAKYVLVSQSARKMCKFAFGSCKIAVSRPSTAIVPMKPFVLVCSKKMSGLETRYNFSEL